jgi:hypothetical protein
VGDEVIEGIMHPFVFEAESRLQVFDEGVFYFVCLLEGEHGGDCSYWNLSIDKIIFC